MRTGLRQHFWKACQQHEARGLKLTRPCPPALPPHSWGLPCGTPRRQTKRRHLVTANHNSQQNALPPNRHTTVTSRSTFEDSNTMANQTLIKMYRVDNFNAVGKWWQLLPVPSEKRKRDFFFWYISSCNHMFIMDLAANKKIQQNLNSGFHWGHGRFLFHTLYYGVFPELKKGTRLL